MKYVMFLAFLLASGCTVNNNQPPVSGDSYSNDNGLDGVYIIKFIQCSKGSDCPSGYFCTSDDGFVDENNHCEIECKTDNDCMAIQKCVYTAMYKHNSCNF